MNRKSLSQWLPLLGLALLAWALWVLYHELRHYHYQDIVEAVRAVTSVQLGLALGFMVLNYGFLTLYDTLAFRYLNHHIPYRSIAPVSFIAYSFSHNLGLSVLSGGSMRYHLYYRRDVSSGDVARAIVFCVCTFWIGFLTVGTWAFLVAQPSTPTLHWTATTVRLLGVVFLAILAGYLLLVWRRRTPLSIKQVELTLPSLRMAGLQIVLSSVDWLSAAATLYVLLPAESNLSFAQFVSLYIVALVAGLVSSVPGGLGVFETVLIVSLPETVKVSDVFGSLLVFRLVYYIIPLVSSLCLLSGLELMHRKEVVGSALRRLGKWFPQTAPYFLSAITFFGGTVLLVSGSMPALHGRMLWLDRFIHLTAIEMSHFLASLTGACLLLLARGIQRRLDAAYFSTLILLIVGVATSLLKGLDWEEAVILLTIFILLVPCRRHFFVKTSLLNEPFTAGWILSIGLILLCTGWLGFFAHKHVEYTSNMWWQFALKGDAPRMMRANVGVVVFILFLAIVRMLKPVPEESFQWTPEIAAKVRAIVQASPDTTAHLALFGDKNILFSESGQGILMYAVAGRSWVAMGDPIGPPDDILELAWRFRELCDRHGGWTVFYQVSPQFLPLYIDLGLTLNKLGEEGRIRLETFDLEGGAHKGHRRTVRTVEREGFRFEVIPRERTETVLPQLKAISDHWIKTKHAREKRFSLGFFDEDVLRHQPIGVVMKDERIVAFANLLVGDAREEISVDLMRYGEGAPTGVMEYLFVELMLWSKEQEYQWFSMGMAPLSGLENRALATLWNRAGAFVFKYGEHFYNFQGVRLFKQKFDPVWEPRYLASPGGFAFPQVLANVSSLISGSVIGIFAR